MNAFFKSRTTWGAALLLAVLAGLGYWQRRPMLAWYYVRALRHAGPEERDACAANAAAQGEAAVPRLLDGLRDADADACANMQAALFLLAKTWGPADPRTLRVVASVRGELYRLSPAGREQCLHWAARLFELGSPPPPRLTQVVSDLLVDAEKTRELRGPALVLAAALVDNVQPGQLVDVCRGMTERGLKEETPGTRAAALRLLGREAMRREKDLLAQAVPLLCDADPAVRRAALVTLAPASDVATEEHFLLLLHDDDPQVQLLCEHALRKRGLQDDDIRLARLIADPNPAQRMRVFTYLHQRPEMNVSECLRRLSHDPEPAVRAAAVRAASQFPRANLLDRLREMAQRDPSDTVRRNAQHYLQERELVQTSGR